MNKQVKNKKVYEQVIEYINNMIIDGKLKKGDRLPTEREFAKKLDVSRTSIREALKTLDTIGLVNRRQGDGTFIKNNFDDCLFEPLSMMFKLEECNVIEILELRNMIEAETAFLAAKRITDDEITQLSKVFEKMVNETDENLSAKYDKEFHYIIAKASKNLIILNYYNAMSSIMDSFIKETRLKVFEEDRSEKIFNLHKNIYLALLNRDCKGASDAMRDHMELINSCYYYS
ncbi:FadR/GntR family transcriptional regulator [Tepidibacter aestuarii]|uniref:FadR/GntR family transcriptional regulator n=1 Tax=Tepidibacter aestuarii TaxID=2925782 RepID=UPI0020C16F19|nr:FadR/GntR family transcriptional regulator [Tepidibacter aestuarii]CAH2213513.1 GntR family transcriptional regulator, transcriptional repressor for pyruvate dehydrogenase complex [Tepidibacter aestuarii]